MSYSQVVSSNLPMLLHFEDRDSMAFSIEARVPFLDYRLAQFYLQSSCIGEDQQWHYQIGIAQGHARRAARKVLNRKDKMGFVTPEAVWVKEYSAQLRSDLEKAVAISNGFINQHIVENSTVWWRAAKRLISRFGVRYALRSGLKFLM